MYSETIASVQKEMTSLINALSLRGYAGNIPSGICSGNSEDHEDFKYGRSEVKSCISWVLCVVLEGDLRETPW